MSFKLKQVELLPPLKEEEVKNIIKFLRLNASALAEMDNYEGCCWSDDIDHAQSYVYDALELGYGLEDLSEYLKDNFGEEEEDEDDE